MTNLQLGFAAAIAALSLSYWNGAARAAEFPAGDPVEIMGMEIAGVFLQPVEMEPMMAGQEAATSDIHLEADIHAIDGNAHGFEAGAWVPYLSIAYTLSKKGSDWTATGHLHGMVASDGPHYGANVALDGPGKYHVTFRILPPSANGFLRHIDAETGVAPWWDVIDYAGDFTFIGTGKKSDY